VERLVNDSGSGKAGEITVLVVFGLVAFCCIAPHFAASIAGGAMAGGGAWLLAKGLGGKS
jgi:hypothetical protein